MSPRWTFACLLPMLFAAVGQTGCRGRRPPVKQAWAQMGTFATVSVPAADESFLPLYAERAAEVCADVELRLTVFDPRSDVSRMAVAAGSGQVAVAAETLEVLRLAERYAGLSGGCFDPTVGPLVRLWGFSGGRKPEREPDPDELRHVMALTGIRHLRLGQDSAGLDLPGMRIDLGGIGKGYAVDRAFEALLESGADDVMVNLGGNVRCGGEARRGQAWRVGVRNPFDRQELIGALRLSGGMAVATSGNYERFVTIGDRRYAHIIDPRNGRPVSGMAGVTVISASAAEADAMSTALFVLGIEQGLRVLRELPDCEALFVPDEQPLRFVATPGFSRYFSVRPELAGALQIED